MNNCKMCGKSVFFALIRYYVPDLEGNKHDVCKDCLQKIGKDKAVKYNPKTDTIEVVEKGDIEVRKACNVCGKVFCYNPVDLEKNKSTARDAKLNALGQLGGALSGNYTASAVYGNNASNAIDKIVDYNKCPHCGSIDLKEISKEEYQSILRSGNQTSTLSAADELKKFKELLEIGVITQEEFDAKKKQILGL